MTIWLMIIPHYAKFGYKRLCSSGHTVWTKSGQTDALILIYPSPTSFWRGVGREIVENTPYQSNTHEPDCLPKRLVCCLQGQGHSEGSYNQNMTFLYLLNWWSFFSTKLGLMAHHQKALCCVVVKVKVTEKVKNSSECLSGWYLLNHSGRYLLNR